MKKIDIIQFLPYFPPHKWGLETHAEEWATWWIKKWYWNVYNITNDLGHDYTSPLDWIECDNEKIGYKKDGYTTYLLPSFDLIHNFPVPKFWTRKYRLIMREIASLDTMVVVTRTRFFLSSVFGGWFARRQGKNWIHIEHGSDSVLLESGWKNFLAHLYDSIFGRMIFRFADLVIWVSEGSREFVQKRWWYEKNMPVIYRGIEVHVWERKKKNNATISLGFVGRVVPLKWVNLLIDAFRQIHEKYPNTTLTIIGEGDQREWLESNLSVDERSFIHFLWEKPRTEIASDYLPSWDILINPSYQEWLPTTVLEWLSASCIVVATDVGGTREISKQDDLILVEKWNIDSLSDWLERAISLPWDMHGLSKRLWELDKFRWENNIETYYKTIFSRFYGN